MKDKAFVLDLDGTLLNSDGKVSIKDKETINKAIDLGYYVIFATGKHWKFTHDLCKELEFKIPLITSQGHVIDLPDGTIKKFDYISINDVQEIFKNVITIPFEFIIGTYQMHIVSNINNKMISLFTKLQEIKETRYINDLEKIMSLYIYIEDVSRTKTIINEINNRFPNLEATYWSGNWPFSIIAIKNRLVNKWTALKYVMQKLQINEFYAIGDGWGDRQLLMHANLSAAMKNSEDVIKNMASYTTYNDNNHSGVSEFIEFVFKKNQ